MGNTLGSDEVASENFGKECYVEGIPPEHCIPRVHKISPSVFMEKYYKQGKPVILTGMMDDWPAVQKWTAEHLKEQIGNHDHVFFYGSKSIHMKIGDYIDTAMDYCKSLESSNEDNLKKFPDLPSKDEKLPYVRHFGPLNKYPNLMADLKPGCMFEKPENFSMRNFLFVGVPHTKTETHYDTSDNFVAILVGQKHIALLPPGGEQELTITDKQKRGLAASNPEPLEDPDNLILDINKKNPDGILMHQHPAYASAKSLVYSPLQRGEMVYIPKLWYHYIHNVDFSVSLTIQTIPNYVQ